MSKLTSACAVAARSFLVFYMNTSDAKPSSIRKAVAFKSCRNKIEWKG